VITRIELEFFKCFKQLKLPISPLTLLSGTNASGKSTVLQSMVLLHQTILDHEWSTRLQLNGSEIQLGTVTDIVDKVNGRREFAISIVDDDCSVKWGFAYEQDKQSMSAMVASVEVNGMKSDLPQKLRFLVPEPDDTAKTLTQRLRSLSYLTAERIGPRDCYPLQDPNATQVVGPRGENAVGLLYQKREASVLKPLVVSGGPSNLLGQVKVRMAQFFPGTTLTIEPIPQANMVTLGISNSSDAGFHRPVNVGFGLTQVFPIIVAALASAKNELLLIENPEVHLHPAGQALMAEFLAEVAASGVQVVIESHSDHVLNGIRKSVKRKTLSPESVALHFFRPRSAGGEQVVSPTMGSNGNIDHWPDGFFDQLDKDLNYFAGWEQ
jgi:predicted ATPase